MAKDLSFYEEGHLVAACIRLHTYQHGVPPSPEDIAATLSISVEKIHHLVNRMAELGAVRVASGAYGVRVLLDDHTKIEELEGKEFTPSIEEELTAFQAAQAKKNEEMAKRFSKDFVDEKKESLKADLASKLADPSKLKKSDNPLDQMFKKKNE